MNKFQPKLPYGYTQLPPGKIAAVVTYLEMRALPAQSEEAGPSHFLIRRVKAPELDWYRKLFREIGEPWLWFSRLRMSDDDLRAILHNPEVEIFALTHDGRDIGLAEYDARHLPEIELSFFGITSGFVGKGAGRALLGASLPIIWQRRPQRIWLHTCTLDHPAALSFYRKAGFIPYRRAIEIADDPRLTGDLARDAAPNIPIL